jgi:hypothetical protein
MGEDLNSLEQTLLRHLLTYRGHQVRFEADAHTTEFGIYRSFTDLEAGVLKNALRQLETSRWIYRRIQYVIGFSEPKLVYSLTPNGYRKALDLFGSSPETGPPAPTPPAAAPPPTPVNDNPPTPPAPPRKSPPRRRPHPPSGRPQE